MQTHPRRNIRVTLATLSATVVLLGTASSTTTPPAIEIAHESRTATAPAPPDPMVEAERSIARREYEATDSGKGLQAPNRAHGLRTYFDAAGARVVDREDDATGLARLRTVGVGRDELRPVSPGEVVADGARVEVRRQGLVEWYENSEAGLEQGWTLSSRPAGDGPLAIEIDFGGATARVEGDRSAVVTVGGRRLVYGDLSAFDAEGTSLRVSMAPAFDDRVRLVVEDADATYPITVDPMLTQPAFATLMGDQAGAAMGYTVAGAGDVNHDGFDDCIVGAPFYDNGQTDEGAAFVYLGGPNGIASGGPTGASARLESNQANATFGVSVAGAGDVNHDGFDDVIVGAEYYDSGQTDEGAAFVFLGGPSGIANGNPTTAATTLQSNQAGATFGYSVASAGDVNDDGFSDVIVGAPDYSSGQTKEGGAFVFLGSASGIASGSPSTANTVLQSDQANAGLGISVASAGDVNNDGYADAIVGARLYDNGTTDAGAAFVYLGGASGITSGSPASASATIDGAAANTHLGISVAGAGDVNNDGYDDVIIGANGWDTTLLGDDNGIAVVFHGGPAGIESGGLTDANSILSTLQVGANEGISVAGAGDVNGDGYDDVIVGAHLYDNVQTDEGAAFLFVGGPGGVGGDGYSEMFASAFLQSDQAGARFGVSVAGIGDVNGDGYADVAAGASFYDSGQIDEGAAFVYLGSRDGLNGFPVATASLEGNQVGAHMGASVASAGDVNNDGYDDIIVGAPVYDSGQTDEGAAFVFYGGPAGIGTSSASNAGAILQSDQAGAKFGASVAGAGDVNGDGYDDVIVGAPNYGGGFGGEAFVFHGGPAGVGNGSATTASASLHPIQSGASFGASVAGAGDVNNDGYDDVIVGAPAYTIAAAVEGAAFVFHGGPTGVGNGSTATANAILRSNQPTASLGWSVASAGDVNGDGYSDVIVGAYQYDAGETNEGAAFVYFGGPTGVGNGSASNADATLQSDQANAYLGFSVAGAGDVNNDGYDDVIVGAWNYDAPETDEGTAYVFLGGPLGVGNGNASNADTTLQSDQVEGQLGASVAGAGDVNDDGYDDVVVGSYYGPGSDSSAFVFLGGINGIASGTPRTAAATLGRFEEQTTTNVLVAGAGDTNGDGFDDVIVGAQTYSHGQSDEGGAFVYNLQRPAGVPTGSDTVGIYVPSSGAWFLRNTNASGGADVVFTFGAGGGGLVPIRGDWDGDGDDTPGLYNPATGAFFLRNSSSNGGADVVFTFGAGNAGYVPMVGDWNGDGTDTIGLYVPSTSVFFLRNQNASGGADAAFSYGPAGAGWTPISGDWDGNGTDTVGLFAPSTSTFFLRNQNASGGADLTFGYGPAGAGWRPMAGDFDGNGADTVGLYNPSNGFFFLRNSNAPGAADLVFGYGPAGVTPLVGDWDGT